MARFFQNLDSDEKQIRHKTSQLGFHSEDDGQTGETSKLDEIATHVDDILSSGSSFAKLAKRLLADLKRCIKSGKYTRLPSKIIVLFNDERFKKSSQLSSQAAEIMKNFTDEKQTKPVKDENVEAAEPEAVTGKKTRSKKRQTELDSIFSIISDEEKEMRLREYLLKSEEEDERCAIAQALFSIYSRRESSNKMLWVLEEFQGLLETSNSEYARRFRSSPEKYLLKIYDCLLPNEYDRYRSILTFVSSFNREAADYRLLQFQFFKLSLNPSTEHPKFRLLYYTRRGDWKSAVELFNANDSSFYDTSILLEFADLALENGEFITAYEVFSHCLTRGVHNLTVKIYALCVILNKRVADTASFVAFIEAFKVFDLNELLLRSQDPIEEIFRAFYLLHALDYNTAAKIIHTVAGIECTEALQSCVATTMHGFNN
ncbi:hypothetical protein PAEPH01_2249 [Pancytospora epiphaga]|nr:hypothetical protein PAEPH01_2249 [Pancytospora epiphaga]